MVDSQEPVAAALLRRFDHCPPQTHERLLNRLGHAALGSQRHDPHYAQFDRLLDKPFLPVALGQRHAECHVERQLPVDGPPGDDGQFHVGPSDAFDGGRKLIAAAVEERHLRAGRCPHHVDQVMRLRPGERHAIGGDRYLDEVAI